MAEIVPPKILELRILYGFISPGAVLGNVEHALTLCRFLQLLHRLKRIVVHVDRPWRSVLGLVCHDRA